MAKKKPCRDCGRVLILRKFDTDNRSKDGRTNKCKVCRREYMNAYRRLKGRPNQTGYTIAWRKRNPERAKLRSIVAYAIRLGILVRQPCEVCGAEKVHAHHDDYSKPLEVRWLCRDHHNEFHFPI